MASRLYTPPKGYYDLPFTWLYDGSGLTDGQNALNQFVYLQGGYGDFILRRVAGFNRVVAQNTGQFQMRDRYKAPLQSAPVFANAATGRGITLQPDYGFPHEEMFPETGQLSFDLYGVQRDANVATAQIAFQGARRMKGNLPRRPAFRAKPKTFTYVGISPPLVGLVGADAIYLRQKVDDYDFELYNIILSTQKVGSVEYISEITEAIFTQKNILVPFTTSLVVVAGPNVPFSFTVTGSLIQFTPATDGLGNITSTWGDVLAAYNASPAAQALASLQVFAPLDLFGTGDFPLFPVTVTGTFGTPVTVPLSKLWIYDSNKVTISSAPMLDIFCDGAPSSVYQDGTLCPPVYYPKDSLIQIGFYSMLTDPTLFGTQYEVHLVGKQWIPC